MPLYAFCLISVFAHLISHRVSTVGSIANFFQFDLITASSCLAPLAPHSPIYLEYLLPLVLYCMLALFMGANLLIWKLRGGRERDGSKFHKSPYIRTAFGISATRATQFPPECLLASLPPVCRQLSLFCCPNFRCFLFSPICISSICISSIFRSVVGWLLNHHRYCSQSARLQTSGGLIRDAVPT